MFATKNKLPIPNHADPMEKMTQGGRILQDQDKFTQTHTD